MPASSGKSANDVRAGGAFVELFTKDNLTRGLLAAESRLKKFGAFAAKIGAGLFGVGGAALGAAGGLLGGALNRAVDFQRLGDKLGVPTDKLQAFAYAAETTGLSLEDLKGDWENLAERIIQGAEGTGEAAEAFKKLGIDAGRLKNLDAVDQMLMLADALGKVTNETERLGILSSLGGDQFQNLNSLFRGGSAGIRAKMQEGVDVGAVMSPERTKELAAANEKLVATWTAVKNVFVEVGAALVPSASTLESFRDIVVNVAKGIRSWVQENAGLIRTLALVAGGIAGAGLTLIGLGIAAATVGSIIGGITATFAFLLSPIGKAALAIAAVTAALIAGGYVFFTYTESGREMWKNISAYFADLLQVARDTFGGIADAISAGDIGLAWNVAMAGLTVAWKKVELTLTQGWVGLKDLFVDTWHEALNGVRILTNNFVSWMSKQWLKLGITDGLTEADLERQRIKNERDLLYGERDRKSSAIDTRIAQLAEAERALEEARQELANVRQQAADKAARGYGGGGDFGQDGEYMQPMMRLGNLAKGLFGGPYSQALGIADKIGEQQLKAQRGIEKEVQGLRKDLRGQFEMN